MSKKKVIAKGHNVEAKWTDGDFYPGVVASVQPARRTATIAWADGDEPLQVPFKDIRNVRAPVNVKAKGAHPAIKDIKFTPTNYMIQVTTGPFKGKFLSYTGDHRVAFVVKPEKALVFLPIIAESMRLDHRYGGKTKLVPTDRERSADYAHLDPKPIKKAAPKKPAAKKTATKVTKVPVKKSKILTFDEATDNQVMTAAGMAGADERFRNWPEVNIAQVKAWLKKAGYTKVEIDGGCTMARR